MISTNNSGLLAGLFEPPTTPISSETTSDEQKTIALATLSELTGVKDWQSQGYTFTHSTKTSIPHIFSHINMTYHIQHLIIDRPETTSDPIPCKAANARWLTAEEVENANIGTGVKKVWAEIYGKWGSFDSGTKTAGGTKGKGKGGGLKRKSVVKNEEGKIVKKVMMPMMPGKSALT
jgi:A/G-specific adenine glycosylase